MTNTQAISSARRGILLAGGAGTRLHPATRAISKQLLPVYDKPMVYYPLTTLMLAGVREVLVITAPDEAPRFERLLGDGTDWGMRIAYAVQARPEGIAQALLIARDFLGGKPSALALGDNIHYGADLVGQLREADRRTEGATLFASAVTDPERYGVVSFDAAGLATRIVEKPREPESRWAVTGLYFYDALAPQLAADLRPSARGELEITDLNNAYLARGAVHVQQLGRGTAWLDAGTHESLLEASQFIHTLEKRQGLKVGSPEEAAWRNGWIDTAQLAALARAGGSGSYATYLAALAAEAR